MQLNITLKRIGKMLHKSFLVLGLLCFISGALQAQTTITTEGNVDYTGLNSFGAVNSAVTFVVENTNSYAITITSVQSYFDPAIIGATTTVPTLWYSSTSLSGAPTIGSPAWTSIATGAALNLTTADYYTAISGITFSVPAGATYRFALQSDQGLSYSGSGAGPNPTQTTFSADGVNMIVGSAQIAGANIGYAGAFPSPTFNPRFFTGSITFSGLCVPVNATAPIISTVNTSTCAGSPITLSIAGGYLNGAQTWNWYTGSCGGTAAGTGTSITVTPAVTTTYYARGEGGCAPAAGPCDSVTVTVTNCTCLAPDSAKICAGSIQRLSVAGAGVPGTVTQTSGSVNLTITDNDPDGISNAINIAAIPAGASITSITANLNILHTWDSDLIINLKGPGGSIINLVNSRGLNGDNFTNTNITSTAGAPSLATGIAPFTGTFAPDGVNNIGPTAFVSNVTSFSAFDATAVNGDWTLAINDNAFQDEGTLSSWGITINYTVLNTATWSGGALFTNAAATTPYVAGTEANAVYVQPAATTTYTATIASGPCAGANTVTVTVLPRPAIAVTPTSGCGPLDLTASGGVSYSWSPSSGLSSNTGATVTANPATTTTYTVLGTGANTCTATATATVNSAPTASVIAALATPVYQIQEGFTVAPPVGWVVTNNSAPGGTTTWFQGAAATFPSFNGAANSYVAANYQNTNTAAGADISDWLLTPVVNISTGDQISFYTRTTTPGATVFPDRLEVRLSTAGASTNVGTTTTSVGDFTTLLIEINPTLTTTGYPNTWTRFTATVTGITGTVQGRIGFRYFVTDGGGGNNSDYIGIDQVEYSSPPAPLCGNVVSNIAVNITGGVGPYTVVFTEGTTNTTITGYTSGSLIQVSPAATTSYTIVSVTGANGCVGTGNTGSADVIVTPPPSITTQPADASACVGTDGTISVTAAPALGNSYQWQVSTDGGATFTDVTNGSAYSGATTSTLTIIAATLAMDGYQYRVQIVGTCAPTDVTSDPATLSVNVPAVINTQPVNVSVCADGGLSLTSASFTVAATGGGLTYQWQVSPDGVAPYTNVTDGGVYSGSTTNTLTITNPPTSLSNYHYVVNVASGGCTPVASDTAILTVNDNPAVTISAGPTTALYPGLTSTITAAVSPAGTYTYQWYLNGVPVPGATSQSINVNVDGFGDYTVAAIASTGCSSLSNAVTITSAANDIIFIYPSPNTGQFQVRYYAVPGNPTVRSVSVYDSKGARVFSRTYNNTQSYSGMNVDLGRVSSGIYRVELNDRNGRRIKTGSVIVL